MARDTRCARDIRNEVDDRRLKKKLNGEKDGAHCSSSRKADISGSRRSGSPQSFRNFKNLEKGNSPNPLRRCHKGTNNVTSSSPGHKQTVKVLSFSEEKGRKEKYPKQAVMVESEKCQVGLKSVSAKRRKITGHAYHKRFRNMCPDEIVLDIAGAIERPGKLCVDEPPGGDSFKKPQTILNVKDTLCDNKRLAINSSPVTNLYPIELASSTSLVRSQDGDAHSDCDGKYNHPKGPGKLSADCPNEPPDGNVLKDSPTGLDSENLTCSVGYHDGAAKTGTEATPPAPESVNHSLSVISVSSSKRKRISCDLPENEFCSCGAPVGSSSCKCCIAGEDFGELSNIKERGLVLASEKTELEFLLERKIAETDNSSLNELENMIYQIQKKCHMRLKKLRLKQQKKIREFQEISEEERLKLEGDHKLQSAFIRSLHDLGPVRTNKLKHLDYGCAKKMGEHNRLRETELEELEAEQLAAMNEETHKVECWLSEATACYTKPKLDSLASQHIENQSHTKRICRRGIEVAPPKTSVAALAEAIGCNVPIETTNTDSQNKVVVPSLTKSSIDVIEPLKLPTSREGVADEIQPVELKEVSKEVLETVSNGNIPQDRVLQSSAEAVGFIVHIEATSIDSQNEVVVPSLMRSSLDVVEPLNLPPSREDVYEETQSVELIKEVPEEVPEAVSNENVLQDRVLQSSAELQEENVLIVGNQQISDTEVFAIAPADTVTIQSNIHLQDQATPAIETQSIVQVANPEHIDIVNPEQIGVAARVDTVTSTESAIELQDKDAPAAENQITLQMENPVMKQPDRDAPAVENQSSPFSEVTTSELADNVTPPFSTETPIIVNTVNPVQSIMEHQNILIVENERTEQIEGASLVDTVTSTRSDIELQEKDAPAVQNPITLQTDNSELMDSKNPQSIMEQSDPDAPAAEDRSALFSEVATSELADTVILPFSTDAPNVVNIERTDSVSIEVSPGPHQLETEPPTRYTSSQNSAVIYGTVVNAAELPNQAVLQFGSAYLAHPTSHPSAFLLSPTSLPDPLQIEFETLRKKIEHLKKSHKETASETKSDYEKEMLELRRKYEMKLQVDEAEFRLKKNELEKNQSKVFWNGMLAEAFRSECFDIWPTGHPGMQQGNNWPNIVQQPHQQSMRLPYGASSYFQPYSSQQQILSAVEQAALLQHSTIPSSISNVGSIVTPPQQACFSSAPPQQCSSGINQPSFVQQPHQQSVRLPPYGASSSCQPINDSQQQQIASPVEQAPPPLEHSTRPPPISNVGSVVTPALHTVQQAAAAAARFSGSRPSRPLIINNHTPGNPRNNNSVDIRGPPPHLQRAVGPAAASSALPHLQAQQTLFSRQTSQPLASEGGGFPVNVNSSLSALELLMDMDQQPRMSSPIEPSLPEIRQTSTYLPSNIVQANHTSSSAVAASPIDVVCLSDDDQLA